MAVAVALQMQNKECFCIGYNGTGSVEELLGNELGAWQKEDRKLAGLHGSWLLGIITKDFGWWGGYCAWRFEIQFIFVHRMNHPGP